MKQTLTQFCIVLIDSDAWITGMGKRGFRSLFNLDVIHQVKERRVCP